MSSSKPLRLLPSVPKKCTSTGSVEMHTSSNSSAAYDPSNSSAAYDPSNMKVQFVPTVIGLAPIIIYSADSASTVPAPTVSGVKRPITPPPATPTGSGGSTPLIGYHLNGIPSSPWSPWCEGGPDFSPPGSPADGSPARSSRIGRVLELHPSPKSPKSPLSSHTEEGEKTEPGAPRKQRRKFSDSNSAASCAEVVGDAIVAEYVPLPGIVGPPNPKRFRAFRDGMHPNASQHPTGALLPALSLAGLYMTHLPKRTLSGCVGNCRYTCTGKCKGSF